MALFEKAFQQVLRQAARKLVLVHHTLYFDLMRGPNGSLYVVANTVKDPNERVKAIFDSHELDEAIAHTNQINDDEKASAVKFIHDLKAGRLKTEE